jgi:DNA repair protein RecN (Recombination protein N)
MLRAISIRNVVLIESLDLEFGAGLSVFSGETGAGKSILLGSLGLVLGERADLSLVRQGTKQATVTAVFDDLSQDIMTLLDNFGIQLDDQDQDSGLIIKRVVGADGRSKAFINGEPVSVASLRALGQCLAEVHGQFESQSLLNPSTHRGLLDA